MLERSKLLEAIRRAADWITDTAQHHDESVPSCSFARNVEYTTWKGSIKGEYSAAHKNWDYFCPIWHTGQAVKALCQVYNRLGDQKYLDSAILAAEFICDQQVMDKEDQDYGMILAYEDFHDCVNTSAIFEAVDGLLCLYDITGNEKYRDSFVAAMYWCINKPYYGQGVFRDVYNVPKREFMFDMSWLRNDPPPEGSLLWHGRPLNDDSCLLKAYQLTGDERFREIFYEVEEYLLELEGPEGTWLFQPCNIKNCKVHPRQTYWFGMPFYDAYLDTKEQRYLDVFLRCGTWYRRALRKDGGLFRTTYKDFGSDSFGHATSGAVCAGKLFLRLYHLTGDESWLSDAEKPLNFAMGVQFIDPMDKNLRGAVLEKIVHPHNSDASPYYLRDLSTIFFVQEACEYLDVIDKK